MAFLWQPGNGCDPAALRRLRDAFPCPNEPMGEAWFMGKSRAMFDWLFADPASLTLLQAEKALDEIASGVSAFGPFEEWHEWFHYLLPRLLPRCHEAIFLNGSTLLDALTTAFITQYPAGIAHEPYPGFRADALATLGSAMMDGQCWADGEVDVVAGLSRGWFAGTGSWMWWMVSGKLSASLFFCLKYLDAADVAPWLGSVLAIRSPHFVGQMIAWLVGARPLLAGTQSQPSELPDWGHPDIRWFWSHVLKGNYTGDHSGRAIADAFLPETNRANAIATIVAHLSGRDASDWLATISADPDLESDLGELPFELCRLYARH